MRAVHANEGPARLDQFPTCVLVAEPVGLGAPEDRVGELPSRLVLLAKGLDQLDHPAALLELGEEERLFELLVVILDELPHQRCRGVEDAWRNILLVHSPAREPAQRVPPAFFLRLTQ